ncbi:methyltransferase [Vibrio kagoshimensis]|uniref:tRNA1(Val) (adenine(37)-N6)-methyltransferase n=1 Tax=Vibrio kagoshimensis TaxID=2910244 RepID=UPI003D208C40
MKKIMIETKSFNFKQFSIFGGQSGMPVSTDGVLLGAWANFANKNRIIDIGSGTGLLSLMIAQRYVSASIDAVDIDRHAIKAATININNSPWKERITLHHGDITALPFNEKFDGVICNPPYFNSGEQAKNSQRATARHTHTLAHNALIEHCFNITTEGASAYFILPTPEGEVFINLANASGWSVSRRLEVKTTEKKSPSRLLFELVKDPNKLVITEREQLTIHSNGGYSDPFIKLTKDFYLKM